MAAVVSGQFSHAPGFYRPESMAEHRPSFTAVNGGSSVPPGPSPVHVGASPSQYVTEPQSSSMPALPSEGRQVVEDGNVAANVERREELSYQERRASPAPPPAGAPNPSSGLASTDPCSNSSPVPDLHQPHIQNHPASRPQPPSPPINKQAEPAPSQSPSVAFMSPQKRKRSHSAEREVLRRSSYSQPIPPQSPGSSRVPNGTGNGSDRESFSPRRPYPPPQNPYQQPQPPETYPTPPQHAYPPPPEQPNSQPEVYPRPNGIVRSEYEAPLDPNMARSQERPYYSDTHLVEALQRENRNYDSMPPREYNPAADDSDERPQQYTTYGGSREAGTADLDRKRRKRVFSNRTKTGCMTCRRRKKKCDEQHPECNNCLRGGFVCEGYTIRNTWQKPTNTKQPIPLQSKNGYPQPEATPPRAPYPPVTRYQDNGMDFPPQHSMPGPQPSYEPKRDSISEHESVYGRSTPPSEKSQPAWSKNSNNRPYPSNPPAASKYQGNEHRGSIYDVGPDRDDVIGPMPPPIVNRTGSAQSQYSQPGPPPNPNTTPPNQNVQAAAQAALTHASSRSSVSSSRGQYTEREKMLKGMYYYPNTPALTEDRERCIAAIWRFNNATNPSHGASPEERTRLFRQILSLKPSLEPPLSSGEAPSISMTMPLGSCGERVVVEAPFHCDYGYNITVGDDVLIGADCRISDTCSVTIGARCILSPNVKLICATYPIDPRRRMGSNGPALGRNIVIEEDCWIGAGVTILAGVRVGKSSTVGAGSLLHQDVPRFTVVAGNPAKVSRGIYDGNGDSQ